jgi:outer membrane protein
MPLTHRPSHLRLLPIFLALAASGMASAQAQSLTELYNAARSHDAVYQSARLQFDANLARADQARAGILPSVGLSAAASQTNQDSQVPVSRSYTYSAQTLTLGATQPLYRPGNWATYEQGQKQVAQAQAQLDAAEQDLIVRLSQAYFDVLAARDTLSVVRTQKSAVQEQLASAKRNFEVGTATITDTREAQSRFDLLVAQELAADNDLKVKSLALDQLVGKTGSDPKPLLAPVRLPEVSPADPQAWVDQSETRHPSLRQLSAALEIAQLETRKAQSGHLPTLDLTGSYAMANNFGGSASSTSDSRGNAATVGLSFNLPLFAGYGIQNRVRETLSLEDKARSDLDGGKRSVAQGTRAAFLGVQSGLQQVRALEAAEISSQSALDANKLGYQVGVRINIDVLNAQSQLYDTKAKLSKARYDVLLGTLKLRQASGVLSVDDLQSVNQQLAP